MLSELLRTDSIVYAGYSAGPCVLGPTLCGFETIEDPSVTRLHGGAPVFEGLGVLDCVVVPHVGIRGNRTSQLLQQLADRHERAGTPVCRLRDGEVLVVDGDETAVVG